MTIVFILSTVAVDTNIIPLRLMRAILNIPNCLGGCPITLELEFESLNDEAGGDRKVSPLLTQKY